MTHPIDPEHCAADYFLRNMRLQWIKQHPSADPATCPVKRLDDYPSRHRLALIQSIKVAMNIITGAGGTNVLFEKWSRERQEHFNSAQAQPTTE